MPLVICPQGRRGSRGQSWWVEGGGWGYLRGARMLWLEKWGQRRRTTAVAASPALSQRNTNHAALCLPVSRLYSVFPVAFWKPLKAGCCSLLCFFFWFFWFFFTTLRERASSRKNSLGRCYPETLSMQLSFHAAARPQHKLAAASVHNNKLPRFRSVFFIPQACGDF